MREARDPLQHTLTDRMVDGFAAIVVASAAVVAALTHPEILIAFVILVCLCGAFAQALRAAHPFLHAKGGLADEPALRKHPNLS